LEFPLVSILIPAYNHTNFVEKCLDSALGDPYPNKEIVIINDGSLDDSNEKILSWMARNGTSIKVNYLSRKNRGVTVTLNELATRASGEFLRIVASDDYLLSGGIQAQVEYLMANPRKGAVIGDSVVVGDMSETLFESGMSGLKKINKANYLSDDGIRKEIICHWAIGGPVTMITRKTFEVLGGWSEDLRIEDWDFFLRLIALNLLGFIDFPVGAYRLHGNNTCRTRDTATRIINLEDAEKVALRNLALFKTPYQTMLKAQWFLVGAKIAYLKRKPLVAAIHVLKALFLNGMSKLENIGRRA